MANSRCFSLPLTSSFALLLAASGFGCSGSAPSRARSDAPKASALSPGLRLPRTVLPTSYSAKLALDPALPTFTGAIQIRAKVSEPVRQFWLSGHGLAVSSATIRVSTGEVVALSASPSGDEMISFAAATALPAGDAVIEIEYSGRVDEEDTMGIFRQRDGGGSGDWYLYTQFEALGARRAFPCFDEPDNKVTWQIELEVPETLMALSNTPIEEEHATAAGKRLVRFAPTKPLPSYLVAFAVGPFEAVDAGTSRTGVKLRVVTPKGRATEAAWAAHVTLALLNLLEDYFGRPYPYAKLDSISIPTTVGFGAMENAGLIAYSERLLLTPPALDTERRQRAYANVATHEMAHQWFGNLVTTGWWNDIWLNEAFATWITEKVIAEWKPAWRADVSEVNLNQRAMQADRLASARRINQPIASNDDIDSAFDGITYLKGAAVIRMFERWVGVDKFRGGVRAYLDNHQWGNASTQQFLADMSRTLGRDIAAPFTTFLDQVGTPEVAVDVKCNGQAATLALSQRRYVPSGSSANTEQHWRLPVCVRYPVVGASDVRSHCVLLEESQVNVPLPKDAGCPAWIMPNAGGMGYYRTRQPTAQLSATVAAMAKLTLPERVYMVDNLRAMLVAGHLPLDAVMAGMEDWAASADRQLVEASVAIAKLLGDVVPRAEQGNYARWVRALYGHRARQLGWQSTKGEPEDTALLRSALVSFVARDGADGKLRASALVSARAWLADHRSVSPASVSGILAAAAATGSAEFHAALIDAVKREPSRAARNKMMTALGQFRDDALVALSLKLVLEGGFDIRESATILWSLSADTSTRRMAWGYVVARGAALISATPEQGRARLARIASRQCDADIRGDVEHFLREQIEPLPGGPRAAAQAQESMALCLAREGGLADSAVKALRLVAAAMTR